MNLKTIHNYLMAPDLPFQRRVRLQSLIEGLPYFLKRNVSKAIWAGGWRHLRKFDHRFSFTRDTYGLSAMLHDGREIAKGLPASHVIAPIERPVALVTSGPSALEHDWALLKNSGRMIVAVSGGATFLRERGIIPDLIVVTDPRFCENGGYHIRDAKGVPLAIDYRAASLLHVYFPGALSNRPVSFIERVNRWYGAPSVGEDELRSLNEASGLPIYWPKSSGTSAAIGWSHRLEVGFFPSATVAFVALQALVNLGATDIEIVGMDLSGGRSVYTDAIPSHLNSQYESIILPSFKAMQIALKNRSVTVKNLSPTCPLPSQLFDLT